MLGGDIFIIFKNIYIMRCEMALSTYIIMIFGITTMLYLFGFAPLVFTNTILTQNSENVGNFLIQGFLNVMTNKDFLILMGIMIISSIFAGSSIAGFSALFFIPILLLTVVLNIFIFPTNIILSSDIPFPLGHIIIVFINILLMLSIIEFVRGGST